MADSDPDIGALVDSLAQANGIAIEPKYRQAVIDAMAAYLEGALLLFELPLPDEIEPAGTYEP